MVVVLTDSVDPEHVKRALDLGADYYLVKSRSHEDRHAMARAFEEYLTNGDADKMAFAPAAREAA